uniref:Retrotransposon gag domain-containing protein n=1 Tax=Nymphaea colorata TaxID=210225 RepID=A0A5K1DE56_9MAGN
MDVEEWPDEIEEVFELADVPDYLKPKFSTYMLGGDAKNWWKTIKYIKFDNLVVGAIQAEFD